MNRIGYFFLMGVTISSLGGITGWRSPTSTDGERSTLSYFAKRSDVTLPLALAWVVPKQVPPTAVQSKLWPLYNTALAMNLFPTAWHGIDSFNHWRLPPRWTHDLFKNELHVKPSLPPTHRALPLTLYITLQGTVFLFPQTISGTQWMGPDGYVADIPPSTIVAEFVPLKPAVRAGIIPESHGQPWGLNSEFVPKEWRRALGMSTTQIFRALQ
ncbi:MAG: hypothetical protein M1415_05490 [Firmicutes bacterium]|nr:hypothetical protein [Bacillota bacterium]